MAFVSEAIRGIELPIL